MFCTNCGTKFEGNFCPNCGTPAYSSSAPVSAPVESAPVPAPAPTEPSKYPAPPIGTFHGTYDEIIVIGENSIEIDKKVLDNGKTYIVHNEMLYSDIASVSFFEENPKKPKRCFVCVRPVKITHIPFCDRVADHFDDPFSISGIKREDTLLIYDFLKAVADINAYPIPEPDVLPKKFDFTHLREYTEYTIQGEDPERQARIRENEQNGIACCPKCGSTSLSAGKQGFSLGKAAVGGLLSRNLGGGLLAGSLGSNKTVVTCLNCGHKWNP